MIEGIERQRYEIVDVDRLVEFPGNPNVGDEEAIAESMDTVGWYGVVVTRELPGTDKLQLLAGNHRKKVAMAKGAKQIPAVILEGVDDDMALRIMLGDNETNRRGRYDSKKLADRIRELPDLKGSGFPDDYLAQLEDFERNRAAAAAEKKAAESEPEDAGEEFVEEFGILLECDDEASQRAAYEHLVSVGYEAARLRVLSI